MGETSMTCETLTAGRTARFPFAVSLLALILLPTVPLDAADRGNQPTGFEEAKSLAHSMPAGAIGYVEVAGLDGVLDRLQGSEFLAQLQSSPQYQNLEASEPYRKAQAVRTIVERQLGMDLWTAGKALLGGRVAVAVYPAAEQRRPDVLGLIHVADADTLTQFRERIEPFLVLGENQIDRSETIAGAEVWKFQGKAIVAVRDHWLLATTNRELLTQALDFLAKPAGGQKGSSLAADKSFQAMTAHLGGDHVVRGYLNTEALRTATGGRFEYPDKLGNPLISLLFGGVLQLASHSPYAGLAFDVHESGFALKTGIAGDSRKLDENHRVFFSDPSGPGTAAIPQPSDLVAGITFYRDFANWYRKREQLLQAQVLPGFDKFESGLANLLPGKNFGEDVLPLIGPQLTLVAAPQDYSHLNGQPGVKLPGFGLIIPLAKPNEGADVLQLFFQTLSSILNLQAGQQGRQPWVMTSESYKGVQIAYGRYLEKPEGDRLPLVFNFMPASARVGDNYVICSSVGLCRHLVDELQKPAPTGKQPNRNFNVELYARPLADLLEGNREFFQAQAVQGGKTLEQAQTNFDALVKLVRSMVSFRLSTSVLPEAFEAQLEGTWK